MTQRPADQDQIGVLNAVWLLFDGGIGSIVFLQLLPALLLAVFAAFLGWLVYQAVRPLVIAEIGHRKAPFWFTPLRLFFAIVGVWLIWLSLNSILSVFSARLPYGQPQTWLTIPFWNSFFLMAVLVWIQTGFAMVILSAALRGIPEETIRGRGH